MVEYIFYHFHKEVYFATLLLLLTGIMKLRFCWSTGKSVYSLLADYGVGLEGLVIIHGQFLYQVNDFFRILEDENHLLLKPNTTSI